ncbi:MAG TPA: tyrosine-type recombinase/integrase [Xanthobacteraceae bacterium]|nr:tyrosine-type recombinase/integrase [Xanthobacteraceae bacterium]
MGAMPRPRPLYLHRAVTRHGKVAWYVRRGAHGRKIRIRAEYGTPEFEAAYREAVSSGTPRQTPHTAARGTLGWLWMLYRQSNAWAALKAPTRRQRENIMVHVLKLAGDKPLSRITKPAVIDGIDRRAATPFAAKNFLATMRGLFAWAHNKDLVSTDPTAGVKVVKPKTSGFPVWTEQDIQKFEERWPIGTRERVMLDVFLYTGLRRGDAARLGKQHIRNGIIEIDTEKTGTRVTIPVLPVLQATLDAGPVGDLALIATRDGNPMRKESLGNAFADACRAAGIRKSAHGLRKAAATHAANNGATVAQLEAIFGWSGGRMASHYTKSADRRKLAVDAVGKLARK